jgi:hypothetical protein
MGRSFVGGFDDPTKSHLTTSARGGRFYLLTSKALGRHSQTDAVGVRVKGWVPSDRDLVALD